MNLSYEYLFILELNKGIHKKPFRFSSCNPGNNKEFDTCRDTVKRKIKASTYQISEERKKIYSLQ